MPLDRKTVEFVDALTTDLKARIHNAGFQLVLVQGTVGIVDGTVVLTVSFLGSPAPL